MYNKPVLEAVSLSQSRQSILVFERVEPEFGPYWHYHPEIELTMITQGSGIRFVGDNIEHYRSGDLVLVGQNLPHQWVSEAASPAHDQKAVVIQFQQMLFGAYQEFAPIYRFLEAAKVGFRFPDATASILRRIEAINDAPEALQISELIAVLYELMHLPGRRALSRTNKFNILGSEKEQRRINQVIAYIMENLDQKLTVNRVAAQYSMVPQSFCRWFRQHTGTSFIKYLNRTRIEVACRLLLTTDKPIKHIAYLVGFEDVSHFNRTFRKFTACSPTSFKQKR